MKTHTGRAPCDYQGRAASTHCYPLVFLLSCHLELPLDGQLALGPSLPEPVSIGEWEACTLLPLPRLGQAGCGPLPPGKATVGLGIWGFVACLGRCNQSSFIR